MQQRNEKVGDIVSHPSIGLVRQQKSIYYNRIYLRRDQLLWSKYCCNSSSKCSCINLKILLYLERSKYITLPTLHCCTMYRITITHHQLLLSCGVPINHLLDLRAVVLISNTHFSYAHYIGHIVVVQSFSSLPMNFFFENDYNDNMK